MLHTLKRRDGQQIKIAQDNNFTGLPVSRFIVGKEFEICFGKA